jgi:hypothetical protein
MSQAEPQSADNFKLLHRTLIVLSLALIFTCSVKLYSAWIHPNPGFDMHLYWKAGHEALNGGPRYHHYENFGPKLMPGYFFYSPVFAAAVSPISRLPYVWFARIWYIILSCAFCVYVWSILRLAFKRASPTTMIVALAAFLLFGPKAFKALGVGQADILIWALFGLALTTKGASAWLTPALFIKPHSLLPLAVLCRRGGKRAILAAFAVGTVGMLLGMLVCGPGSFREWLSNIAPLSQGTFYWMNYSPSMGVLRLLRWTGVWEYSSGPLPTAARIYLASVALIGPLLTAWLTRHRSARFQTACVGAAAVLCSPLCWAYYLNILFLPAAVWWGERRQKMLSKQ